MLTIENIKSRNDKIAVVGLGYVGLPLAVAFARQVDVIGFDISAKKIAELRQDFDATGEVSPEQLQAVQMTYTDDPAGLAAARFIIVTVPTPIDQARKPDLRPLESASKTIGR
ncbi:MAG TPA: nucleotide sugar dehydrogenase, partial [Verrucomicrobiae bacterium]|nr:nucleotide sugar dehydrogenase [Verrucomicrobiae bacterium]